MIVIEIEDCEHKKQLVGRWFVRNWINKSIMGNMLGSRCIIMLSGVMPVIAIPKGGKLEIWVE